MRMLIAIATSDVSDETRTDAADVEWVSLSLYVVSSAKFSPLIFLINRWKPAASFNGYWFWCQVCSLKGYKSCPPHLKTVAIVPHPYLRKCETRFLHCALSLAAQCIVIGPVCLCGVSFCVCLFVGLFVCGFVCLWVCYHDNSKLRASIFTKLGL